MKNYQSIHEANNELSDLGWGECVMVRDRTFRVGNRFGNKVLKPQRTKLGDAGIGFIPGERKFNKTASGYATSGK